MGDIDFEPRPIFFQFRQKTPWFDAAFESRKDAFARESRVLKTKPVSQFPQHAEIQKSQNQPHLI
jgi:hypothetical protein